MAESTLVLQERDYKAGLLCASGTYTHGDMECSFQYARGDKNASLRVVFLPTYAPAIFSTNAQRIDCSNTLRGRLLERINPDHGKTLILGSPYYKNSPRDVTKKEREAAASLRKKLEEVSITEIERLPENELSKVVRIANITATEPKIDKLLSAGTVTRDFVLEVIDKHLNHIGLDWSDYGVWHRNLILENAAPIIMKAAISREIKDAQELELEKLTQAQALPKGWMWREFDDGSGFLLAPDGTRYIDFDYQTKEMSYEPNDIYPTGQGIFTPYDFPSSLGEAMKIAEQEVAQHLGLCEPPIPTQEKSIQQSEKCADFWERTKRASEAARSKASTVQMTGHTQPKVKER